MSASIIVRQGGPGRQFYLSNLNFDLLFDFLTCQISLEEKWQSDGWIFSLVNRVIYEAGAITIDSRCGWVISWFFERIQSFKERIDCSEDCNFLEAEKYNYLAENQIEAAESSLQKCLEDLSSFIAGSIMAEAQRRDELTPRARLIESLQLKIAKDLRDEALKEGVDIALKHQFIRWAIGEGVEKRFLLV